MSTMADTWDDQNTRSTPGVASGSTSASKPKISKNIVVPDDWELDEEEEEDTSRSVDLCNKQLWEDANTKIHHPMPSLIISRGTSSTSVALPSLPLNQPPQMRILKRPSPSIPSTASTTSGTTGETLKEREARYHAARERIFGASTNEEPAQQENDDKKKPPPFTPQPAGSVKLVREPRGPDTNGGNNIDTKGFGERRAKRPPANNDIPTE
ncbi:hypothetical protein BYT27DRAFT_7192360 [Phlegmacium glaucopus]|nr:hypothetical protein BYT27DRAFT_7192360 [Phlegmacium glaucopus]